MKLLLDEMISATVAERLRARGHDVAAVQDRGFAHLRGIDDAVLLDHAASSSRAVVTDNVPDFIRCHRGRLEQDQPHFGLLFFTNDTFPRHRHGTSVSQILRGLEYQLRAHPGDDDSSWIRWLQNR